MQGEMWVINTDAQVLASHLCSNKMQIGLESTRGLGCGGNPEVGRVAAEESAEGLKKVLVNPQIFQHIESTNRLR
jgi:cell division protein FtsZ